MGLFLSRPCSRAGIDRCAALSVHEQARKAPSLELPILYIYAGPTGVAIRSTRVSTGPEPSQRDTVGRVVKREEEKAGRAFPWDFSLLTAP